MSENPYNSPTAVESPVTPLRLQRARTVLLTMGAIAVFLCLWELGNTHFFHGGKDLHFPMIRLVVLLGLIYAIWTGRRWARYVLTLFCVVLVCANVSMIGYLPAMFQYERWGDIVIVVGIIVGYTIIGELSWFSNAITGLENFRCDQRELG